MAYRVGKNITIPEKFTTSTYSKPCPKYYNYEKIATREHSLLRFPKECPISRKLLALAGFFRRPLAEHDSVLCFQCGGGINCWDPEDDPWKEHKKWYPECPLIKDKSLHAEYLRHKEEEDIKADLKSQGKDKLTDEELKKCDPKKVCNICKTRSKNIVAIPCGHVTACENCYDSWKVCVACDTYINDVIKFTCH